MVDRSGSTRSIREDRVRTLTLITWLTGPNDASPGTALPAAGETAVPARTDGVPTAVIDDAGAPAADAAPAAGGWPVAGWPSTEGGANPDGRFGHVDGYSGGPRALPAPELPNVRLRPRD